MRNGQINKYENPGELFLLKYEVPRQESDLIEYARFLREEAGIDEQPPIDLIKIRERFGIQSHQAAIEQSGLSDGQLGFMFIKEDDLQTRQRFTEAHELMEFLTDACKNTPDWDSSLYALYPNRKETVCDIGAAALLMPEKSFSQYLNQEQISWDSASRLAKLFEASFLATLYRMMALGNADAIVIVCHYDLKPSEQSPHGRTHTASIRKKLRIRQAMPSSQYTGGYVPKHKSIPQESLIHRAFDMDTFCSGVEDINLPGLNGCYLVEAQRVSFGNESLVISLLTKP